ncbi:hypothetical protein MD484_g7494, partial [Candolleomyces efflorescens]
MSSEASAGKTETTQGAASRVEDVLLGGTVFFKVQETVFEVNRRRLTNYSDIFADMFHLPQINDERNAIDMEGGSKENPIYLEGYEAADFAALIVVLYPSLEDMISGSYPLTKEEWVGVLNLSTRWQMKKTRDLAIAELSSLLLTPLEKVTLAQAHKVAIWLKEGVNEMVEQEETLKPDELEAYIGLRTALRLMWIRDQLSKSSSSLQITLGSLSCPNGHAVFKEPRTCHACSASILSDDEEAVYVAQGSSGTYTNSPNGIELQLSLHSLRCNHCTKCPFYVPPFAGTSTCPLCAASIPNTSFRLLTPAFPSSRLEKTRADLVEEMFQEQMASYESWDQ